MTAPRSLPHTVTFDCWQTLIYEQRSGEGLASGRVQMLQAVTGATPGDIGAAFTAAWLEHQRAWHRRLAFNGLEITQHVLATLGKRLAHGEVIELNRVLEDELLTHDIRAIDGAQPLLAALRGAGVRTALICDTGFSPGRVVRKLLDRLGLLEHLELQIFSDEIRAPKPHPLAFSSALDGLGVRADGAVHVGDLRRSDIAGARAAGMGTVRFRGRNDDSDAPAAAGSALVDCTTAGCEPACDRPEADLIVSSYAELRDHWRAPA
jgi:putative hydrolase of the HAD superfamily